MVSYDVPNFGATVSNRRHWLAEWMNQNLRFDSSVPNVSSDERSEANAEVARGGRKELSTAPTLQIFGKNLEGWLSGRKRFTANEVGVHSPSRVRIPYPPRIRKSTHTGAFFCSRRVKQQSGGLLRGIRKAFVEFLEVRTEIPKRCTEHVMFESLSLQLNL